VKVLNAEQRKRVSVAVEMVNNPGILFLDDPITGLPLTAK
jgi:ABC-type multidrug transport system ATPase subunit